MGHLVTLAAGLHVLAAGIPPVTPSDQGLGIGSQLQTILSWLMFVCLGVTLAGAITAGATLAFANHTGRPDLALRAKTGLLWALAGAFIIGASVVLVNAFYGLG